MNLTVWLLAGMVAGLAAFILLQSAFQIARHIVTVILESIWPPRGIVLGATSVTVIPAKPAIKEDK